MVALAVFGIGIIAVLTVITQNLSTITQVHIKSRAFALAKEGMELVFQIRDTNNVTYYPRDCLIAKQTQDIIELSEEDSVCDASFQLYSGQTAYDVAFVWYDPRAQNLPYVSVHSWSWSSFMDHWEQAQIFNYWNSWNVNTWQPWFARYGYADQDERLWEPTAFARYIQFEPIEYLPHADVLATQLVKVSSVVLFQQWSYTWEARIESFVWNVEP